jgi:molybdopterin/thiamine biosynthesis adenylyltransferase
LEEGKVKALPEFLQSGAEQNLLPWACHLAAAEEFRVSLAEVEGVALSLGLMPSRYQRNLQTITVQNQLKLFRSRVAVIGCGGLGGYVIEELARLGVGTLVAIDPDVFEEHNLNRQLLSTTSALGRAKVEMAAERVAEINPATTLLPVQTPYAPERAAELLGGAQVVVDALDSIPTRLALAKSCAEMQIPLVHGAIAGWYGNVCTQLPGDRSIESLYGHSPQQRGVEQQLGNPSFTPAVVASLESAEVCKLLLGLGKVLRSRCLVINLFDMSFDEIPFDCEGE